MSTAGRDSELARPSAADLPLSGTALGSFDEFSTLHAVVLGTAAGARVPSSVDLSAWLNLYPELTGTELRAMGDGEFPAWTVWFTSKTKVCFSINSILRQTPIPKNSKERAGSPAI